jgi:HK97 family phage portal protein
VTVLQTTGGPVPIARKASPIGAASGRSSRAASAGYIQLLVRGTAATYEGMYRSQVWVWVVVNKLARGVARLPLKVYQLDADGESRRRVREGPIARLLASPWPRASAWDWKLFVMQSLAIHGNALLAKASREPTGLPLELWPVPWRHVEVIVRGDGSVEGYVFHGTEGRVGLAPEDVVHLRTTAGAVGISPLEPLARTLAIEHAAQEWAAATFRNAARPSGAFVTSRTLARDSIPRLRAELEAIYGGVENAGRFAILDQDLKFSPISQSAVDTALIEHRKLTREEVAAAYDVPPPMIGILDRATFSNIETQHQMLYMDSLGPWLTMIEEGLQAQLLGGIEDLRGQWVEFDLSEVLKADTATRAQAYTRFLQGVYTPDELRRLENLPPVGGDASRLWMPVNMLPVGASAEEIAARARLIEAAARAAEAEGRDEAPSVERDAGGDEALADR